MAWKFRCWVCVHEMMTGKNRYPSPRAWKPEAKNAKTDQKGKFIGKRQTTICKDKTEFNGSGYDKMIKSLVSVCGNDGGGTSNWKMSRRRGGRGGPGADGV